MELICTDDQAQSQPLPAAIDIQEHDLCPSENTMSETQMGDTAKVVHASRENQTMLTTQPENLKEESDNMEFIFCSPEVSTEKNLEQWGCFDILQPVISREGVDNFKIDGSSEAALSSPPNNAPNSEASIAETLPGQDFNDIVFSASCESGDCHAAGLLRSLSHPTNDSDSDTTAACLSDLYIFESEAHDFILSSGLNPQDIKCPQSMSLSQTVADSSIVTYETCVSSKAKCDQELSDDQIILESESGESLIPPGVDTCGVTQADAEVVSKIIRDDSPVELWLDACQYFVDDPKNRNECIQSVTQESVSGTTSDVFVPPEETQGSGYSLDACDVIGWSFDGKSWGPPVERWSSVDSWASALSDWAEIIASPAEDLTAAFTEIGAEIDALTQALAEVTTHIETELKSEKGEDVLNESIMGVQDKPLDTENITRNSTFTGQNCQTQEEEGVEPACVRIQELEKTYSKHPDPQLQSMSSREVTASEMNCEETTLPSATSRTEFDAITGLLDIRFDALETDNSDDVILNIVEDTDLEYKSPFKGLQISEPVGDYTTEVKDEARLSLLELVAKKDLERICIPQETLNVTHQQSNTQGLTFLNTTITAAHAHVPEVNSRPGLNPHVQPNTLATFDGACQVEPLWGSPKFITPLAPLSIGSSLVTQTSSSSSLNGDPEATRWVFNRHSVYDEALDCQPESDEVTDFSSGSTEDIAFPKQTETDCSADLKAGEVAPCSVTVSQSIHEESRDLLNLAVVPNDHFIVCEEKQVACITLDLYDPFAPLVPHTVAERMPHKTHKSSCEGNARSKKERPAGQPHGVHTCRKQESLTCNVEAEQKAHNYKENLPRERENRPEHTEAVIDTEVEPQKELGRRHSKKKKKHLVKSTELQTEPENEVKTDTSRTDVYKEKLVAKSFDQSGSLIKTNDKPEIKTVSKDKPNQNKSVPNDIDDIVKKRRLSQGKFGKLVSSLESKLTKSDSSKGAEEPAGVGSTRRKAYSEVVKQSVKPTDPKVVQPIQAVSVSGDPQSLCLWCQFSDVSTDYTVTWRKDRTALTEIKRSAGDESRVSLTISNASHKDLGKYQCELSSAHKTINLDFLLTYELLSEIVVPASPKPTNNVLVEVGHEEESVHCSRLMFKEDFLAEQYFGESHSASIVTEKIHFGEGMHRRAFRTTLQAGQIPLLVTGHPCVLKVHNAISYGTKNNDELVQKNFNLAVEECQVQNTAREYIKAYTAVAQAFDAFGQVPEIIPIYLVHRPSNDIPYATLEEELIGDFVKYSVKDGKEINLMRKDSEAGQKCCAFQHWVYHFTEGNLLVTDMQGVGMRLTDVGIATCKKGYKGFKGNCATSFIDQFKALHQCNSYCEILGLKSLQPKPKKTASAPKSKAQPGATPKKKVFEPAVKGKS